LTAQPVIIEIPTDVLWRTHAACVGEDVMLWFPDPPISAASWRPARVICRQCPVVVDCLLFSLESKTEFGMWGAKTPEERKRIRRKIKVHM